MWLHYRAGRGQDEDDVSGLTAVRTPVLRPLQTGDADVASLQAPHIGPEAISVQIHIYFFHLTHINQLHKQDGIPHNPPWRDSQNAEPGLLVTDAGGSRCHTLDGLCQQVNCGRQQRAETTFHTMSDTTACHSDPIMRGCTDIILTKA